ncbi:hypothetical protein GYMLUDRAFT_340100 [Collybiopsis luxurians FD-317 M1]|nr:hypothetical protein GYMLUDRAFT_340100 [Collybiopsis luxurians FD-317 M1]
MARLNSEEEPDSRRTTTAKKNAAAKKKDGSSNGIWPCTLGNGCNKQFAREADLKRHQRTSKLHAMAGFACPQCEATFTRTDALRRHQKTRHNGAVFDPIDAEDSAPDTQGSAEASSSTSRETMAVPETVQGTPSASGPATGHSSYYREHTGTSPPYPPQGRRVGSSEWSNGHAWPNGNPPPPPGRSTYMYVPSPYYRPDGSTASSHSSSAFRSSRSPPPRSSHSDRPSSPSSTSSHSHHEEPNSPRAKSPAPLTPAPIPPLPPPVQLERLLLEANAARSAELRSEDDQCTQQSFESAIKPDRIWTQPSIDVTVREVDPDRDEDNSSSVASDSPISNGSHLLREHEYGARLSRPEPMEPILTENGEPMLNPAELLTQESLASPEPS